MQIQLLFLGPVKSPDYSDDIVADKKNRWYKICRGTDYRVGDGYRTSLEQQCAFMCPLNLEVYGTHVFHEIDGDFVDEDLNTIDEYVLCYCDDMFNLSEENIYG